MYKKINSSEANAISFLSHKQAVSLNSFSLKAVFNMFKV